jgi:hypothetical protein
VRTKTKIYMILIILAVLVSLSLLSLVAQPEDYDSDKWNSTIDYEIYYGQFKNTLFVFQLIVGGLLLAMLTFLSFYWGYSDLKH